MKFQYLVILIFFCFKIHCQRNFTNFVYLNYKIDSLLNSNNYKKASEIFPSLFINGMGCEISYYNAACVESKLGNIHQSFAHLKLAIACGFNDTTGINRDRDLDNLRSSIYSESIKKIDYPIKNAKLQMIDTLLLIAEKFDQQVRLEYINQKSIDTISIKKKYHEWLEIDSLNAQILNLISSKLYNEDIYKLSRKSCQSIFLLIQHSKEVNKMKEFLSLIENLIMIDKLNVSVYPLIFDRIMVESKGEQYFGTQLYTNNGIDYKLYPISEKDGLQRRREIYMRPTMEKYLKKYNLKWQD